MADVEETAGQAQTDGDDGSKGCPNCPDTPGWDAGIKHLFSQMDVDHMKPPHHQVYLDNYDWMKIPGNASDVYNRLLPSAPQRMPLDGPYWTNDCIACFKAWMDGGYKA